jgi:hypothetical protein
MNRTKWIASLAVILVFACSKDEFSGIGKVDSTERTTEWSWLESAKTELDRKREEVVSLEEQALAGAAVSTQIETTNAEINRMSEELGQRLADYINADPPILGEPMRPDQLAAIRMKSAEDIVIAHEFIELGGDYRKAVDIYQSALAIDPDNPDLKAAIIDAEAKRYMTAERFATVSKGMTEEQVITAIGRPLMRNIREYPEKKVRAWFYPKNDQGEAAGVFFTEAGSVYSTDFTAVKRAEDS